MLALLVEHGRSKTVIVPGGGRFADRVRAAQPGAAMDDATAHHLAIRGMEQYASVLCGINARLYPVADPAGISEASEISAIPIWLPGKLLADESGIPWDWRVTSDSLALWFAGKINAEALILVKSAPNKTGSAHELAETGYLDEYFPKMMKQADPGIIACLGIDEQEILRQALTTGAIPPERWIR